jgi:hypothetical protein
LGFLLSRQDVSMGRWGCPRFPQVLHEEVKQGSIVWAGELSGGWVARGIDGCLRFGRVSVQ